VDVATGQFLLARFAAAAAAAGCCSLEVYRKRRIPRCCPIGTRPRSAAGSPSCPDISSFSACCRFVPKLPAAHTTPAAYAKPQSRGTQAQVNGLAEVRCLAGQQARLCATACPGCGPTSCCTRGAATWLPASHCLLLWPQGIQPSPDPKWWGECHSQEGARGTASNN
jgi:hypothetical protein